MDSLEKRTKVFKVEFLRLYDPTTAEGAKTISFAKCQLLRLNLHRSYDYHDFLNQAYAECIAHINQGHKILKPAPYVRSTMFYLMHKKLRELRKAPYCFCDEMLPNNLTYAPQDLSLECKLAVQAYQNILSSENFTILQWRFIDNKSWAEIVDLLANQGIVRSAESLRKMGSRAKKEVKNEYLRLIEEHGI